jgi:sec-independent protein translocase protein TatC
MRRRDGPNANDEKRMELTEHLAELRTRIIRSLWYLLVGAILAYQFFSPLYGFLYRPLEREMLRQNRENSRLLRTAGCSTRTSR